MRSTPTDNTSYISSKPITKLTSVLSDLHLATTLT